MSALFHLQSAVMMYFKAKANPDMIRTSDLLTKSLWDFSIGFWIIAVLFSKTIFKDEHLFYDLKLWMQSPEKKTTKNKKLMLGIAIHLLKSCSYLTSTLSFMVHYVSKQLI